VTDDKYSDTSGLSPEDQELVRLARADYARLDALPPDAPGGIAAEKQDFAPGLGPDGELNLVHEPDED
jgi:hypothetical protein